MGFLFAWAWEPYICIFYYTQGKLSLGSVFLATFARAAWSTSHLVRYKASWGLKVFITSPNNLTSIPRHMVELQLRRLLVRVVSSSPVQSCLFEQVWFNSYLDQFLDGRFSKENWGAGGNGVGCFLSSACGSDWNWCSLHPSLKGYFYSGNTFMKSPKKPKRWAKWGWIYPLGKTCTAVAGSKVYCPQKGQTGFTIDVLLTLVS